VKRYLLDTTTIIDLAKGAGAAPQRLRRAISAGDELGVCPVIVCEFEAGLLPADRLVWEGLLQRLQFWPISLEAAQHAAADRCAFARRGIRLSSTDAPIAAVAREFDAVLVTGNVKDFPQTDLQVVSWRR